MSKAPSQLARSLMLSLLFVLSACSQEQGSTKPQDDEEVVIEPPGTPNEYLLAVSELEPDFGGLLYDGQGVLNVYVLNANTASQEKKDAVVEAITKVYGKSILTDGLSSYPSTPPEWLDDPPSSFLEATSAWSTFTTGTRSSVNSSPLTRWRKRWRLSTATVNLRNASCKVYSFNS